MGLGLAGAVPFQWTFSFPIEVLVGDLPPGRLAAGLAAQALWTAAGALAVALVWRAGVRRYTAVNN